MNIDTWKDRLQQAWDEYRRIHETLRRSWKVSERVTANVSPDRENGLLLLVEITGPAYGYGHGPGVELFTADELATLSRCRRVVDAWRKNELDELPVDCP